MITRETNAKRKALRVNVPLMVELEGASYAARDWSVLGLGIEAMPNTPKVGEVLDARISLPLPESTLVLPVQLQSRGEHDGISGFDFHELSQRTRRVLRHYIEMSLDGTMADAEQLVAAAALPAAHSPLAHPLGMTPGTHLPNQPARTWAAVALGLAVFASLASVLFYNLEYKVEGTGFVSGSIARITANHQGRVGKLLVRPGMQVEPNTPLFVVENPALKLEVDVLEQHVGQLGAAQGEVSGMRRRAESGLLVALKRDWTAREAELANARMLLDRGAITQRDVMLVASQASDVRQNYLRQVSEAAGRTQSLDVSDGLERMRVELAAKKALLASQDVERTVRAPVRGKVFHIDKASGEYVSAHEPVILLEADVTPSVLLRLPDNDALKLKPGMPATIYVPFEDRKYKATVAAVGLSSVSAAPAATQEGGLGETLVRLEFEDKRVRLPANARVNVWIRSLSSLLS